MGRPLKIRKQNTNGIHIDEGFPNNGNTNNGYSGNNPGVVGGTQGGTSTYGLQVVAHGRIAVKGPGTITTTTSSDQVVGTGTEFTVFSIQNGNTQLFVDDGMGGYTAVGIVSTVDNATTITLDSNATVALTDSAYYIATVEESGLLRQKGAKKFLIVSYYSIQDEGVVAGQAYQIESVDTTDWQGLGAPSNATSGVVFTATRNGMGFSGIANGTVRPVGICTLTDSSNPAGPNQVAVRINNDGTETYAVRLTNHWVRDFNNNSNPTVAGDTKFIATFLNDNGNTDPATGYTLVGIENYC